MKFTLKKLMSSSILGFCLDYGAKDLLFSDNIACQSFHPHFKCEKWFKFEFILLSF